MSSGLVDRREALALLGGLGAAGVGSLGALRAATSGEPSAAPRAAMAKLPWPYRMLNADAVGQRAFEGYAKGHCMYGTFEAIIASVAEQLGEPYANFPYQLFVYGAGGVQGWGTLCGALNGCAAAIQMLSTNPEPLVDELFRWYQGAALPDFEPKGMKFRNVQSAAGSPLCHPSIAKWCEGSGKKAYSPERKERCGVLTAAVARKCALLLNAQAGGKFAAAAPADARTASCMGCHEKGGALENMRSKQNCAPCHGDETLGLKGHAKIKI